MATDIPSFASGDRRTRQNSTDLHISSACVGPSTVRFYMFRPKPDPDQPRRYPAQKWETRKEPDKVGTQEPVSSEYTRNEAVLNEYLHPLGDAGGPLSSMLDEA